MKKPDIICEYCMQQFYADQCIINNALDIVCPDCHSRTAAVSRMDPKPKNYTLRGAVAFLFVAGVFYWLLSL